MKDYDNRRMGYDEELVVFVVCLRLVVKRASFNWGGRQGMASLGRWLSDKNFYRQVHAVFDTAAMLSGGFKLGKKEG